MNTTYTVKHIQKGPTLLSRVAVIDSLGHIVTTAYDAEGRVISAFGYSNDTAGRRTAISRSGEAFGDLSGAVDAYGYNLRNEVVSARRTKDGAPVRGFDEDFSYDPIGNRIATTNYTETGAWSVTSSLTDGGNATTKFAAGATVTVILGERKCKVGDKVISWTTPPDDTVRFTSRKAMFEVRSDGLYIAKRKGFGFAIFVK